MYYKGVIYVLYRIIHYIILKYYHIKHYQKMNLKCIDT